MILVHHHVFNLVLGVATTAFNLTRKKDSRTFLKLIFYAYATESN